MHLKNDRGKHFLQNCDEWVRLYLRKKKKIIGQINVYELTCEASEQKLIDIEYTDELEKKN